MTRLTIRIDFGNGTALGPGKVRLLELIGETGSIRKAAAGMKMSYRRAWLLLKSLEATFDQPLVATATGGKAGGGARLTPLAGHVVREYRALEQAAARGGARHIAVLSGFLARTGSPAQPRRPIRRIKKKPA